MVRVFILRQNVPKEGYCEVARKTILFSFMTSSLKSPWPKLWGLDTPTILKDSMFSDVMMTMSIIFNPDHQRIRYLVEFR